MDSEYKRPFIPSAHRPFVKGLEFSRSEASPDFLDRLRDPHSRREILVALVKGDASLIPGLNGSWAQDLLREIYPQLFQ